MRKCGPFHKKKSAKIYFQNINSKIAKFKLNFKIAFQQEKHLPTIVLQGMRLILKNSTIVTDSVNYCFVNNCSRDNGHHY